jgi:hypothetical protein
MPKRIRTRYRIKFQKFMGLTDEQMKGKHVHHKDGNRNNHDLSNLELLTPEEHAKIHEHEFIKWAQKGAELGNLSFKKRLKEKGPTEKELKHREWNRERCKKGLHRVPHTRETKMIISKNKRKLFEDKSKHPMWGNSTYEVESPDGKKSIISGGWTKWCIDNNLQTANMLKVAKGERKHHKGWKVKKINAQNKNN